MLYGNKTIQLKEEIEYMSYLRYIMFTFNKSFINSSNELILVPRCNAYFRLEDVTTKKELQRKLISFLPYHIITTEKEKHRNEYLHNLNAVLDTNFTFEDILLIKSKFGGGSDKELAYKFIDSGFDLSLLSEPDKKISLKIKDMKDKLYILNFESDHYQQQSAIIDNDKDGKLLVRGYKPLNDPTLNYNACSLDIIDSTGNGYDVIFNYGEEDLDYIEDIILVMEALILAYQDMSLEEFNYRIKNYIQLKKEKEGD